MLLSFLKKITKKIAHLFVLIFLNNILCKILAFVQSTYLNVLFYNYGLEEDEFDNPTTKTNFAAKLAYEKVNRMEFPPGIEGDALRAHSKLYERTISQCPLYIYQKGLNLADIQFAREIDGGIRWINRSHPELRNLYTIIYIGIDNFIVEKRCNKNNNCIRIGKTKSLKNLQMDIVLCIQIAERCNLYRRDLFNKIIRLLKPNGYLCYADIHMETSIENTLQLADEAGLDLVCKENISMEVANGMLLTWPRYELLLDRIPLWAQPFRRWLIEKYFLCYNSFEKLRAGEHTYWLCCWQKKDHNCQSHIRYQQENTNLMVNGEQNGVKGIGKNTMNWRRRQKEKNETD